MHSFLKRQLLCFYFEALVHNVRSRSGSLSKLDTASPCMQTTVRMLHTAAVHTLLLALLPQIYIF